MNLYFTKMHLFFIVCKYRVVAYKMKTQSSKINFVKFLCNCRLPKMKRGLTIKYVKAKEQELMPENVTEAVSKIGQALPQYSQEYSYQESESRSIFHLAFHLWMTILNVETGRVKLRDLVPIVPRHNVPLFQPVQPQCGFFCPYNWSDFGVHPSFGMFVNLR